MKYILTVGRRGPRKGGSIIRQQFTEEELRAQLEDFFSNDNVVTFLVNKRDEQ